MVGAKGAHETSRFLRRLQMRRALGIQSTRAICPAKRTRGRDRRRGTWWDLKQNCVAIEGQDFAQDTEEGGADQFELIPDFEEEEEGSYNGPSLLHSDVEFVPETEPHDIVVVSSIDRPCNNQVRPRLGTMLHEWLEAIKEEEPQCARKIATNKQKEVDLQDSAKEDKEHKDNPDAEKKHDDNTKELHQKASFSDMETDDEASWGVDGVDLRSHSEVEEDSTKELHHKASFSDMETDDEASWVVDGVDLRGYSQVEEDSWVQDDKDSHGCSHVETDDFKDKVNELIIALFPAYRDVLRKAKR